MTSKNESLTSAAGVETTYLSSVGIPTSVRDAGHLRDLLEGGHPVEAGPGGFVVAELALKDGEILMTRRDADDEISEHRLSWADTDAARLAAHWTGFCESALKDHDERRERQSTRAPGI